MLSSGLTRWTPDRFRIPVSLPRSQLPCKHELREAMLVMDTLKPRSTLQHAMPEDTSGYFDRAGCEKNKDPNGESSIRHSKTSYRSSRYELCQCVRLLWRVDFSR